MRKLSIQKLVAVCKRLTKQAGQADCSPSKGANDSLVVYVATVGTIETTDAEALTQKLQEELKGTGVVVCGFHGGRSRQWNVA